MNNKYQKVIFGFIILLFLFWYNIQNNDTVEIIQGRNNALIKSNEQLKDKLKDLESDIDELKDQNTENEEKIQTLERTVENIEDYLSGNRNY
jgi:predicted  nucleic acid-binding Zn-ribbon protein